ncbi:MAG: hypothetical protein AAB209_12115, partial [Bacteroidota bacterium]
MVFIPLLSFGQIRKLNLEQAFPVLQADNHIWIGTPSGLYQYSPSDDSYKKFVIPTKYQTQNVKQLFAHRDWLWCVLDTGLAALQIRLNDWLFFDARNGLPASIVNNIDFIDDYVWAATDNGVARFDLLIEQWEVFDQKRGLLSPTVSDIKSFTKQVWLTNEKSFSEYNPQFEKWRHFSLDDASTTLKRCFILSDEI